MVTAKMAVAKTACSGVLSYDCRGLLASAYGVRTLDALPLARPGRHLRARRVAVPPVQPRGVPSRRRRQDL